MLQLNFSTFPVLNTPRLKLRKLSSEDDAEILQLRSNSQVNEFIDRPPTVTIEEADEFIKKIISGIEANNCIYWVIEKKDDETLIGTIGLWNFNHDKWHAEVGYELHPTFQAKGFMQEAIEAVVDYAFNNLMLKTIIAVCDERNNRSTKLLLKNNFELALNNSIDAETTEGYNVYIKRRTIP